MRNFDAGTQTYLAAGNVVRRGAITFSLASGIYGFWDGGGPIVFPALPSVTFQPGAQLIDIDWGESSLALDSSAVTVKIYANPDAGLTGNVLQTIFSEVYHQKPVSIFKAYFNTDSGAVVDFFTVWRGYIDQIVEESDEKEYALVGKLESRSIDYTKRGAAMRSNAHQQQISTGDKGCQYSGVVGTVEVSFGRESSTKLAINAKPQPVL